MPTGFAGDARWRDRGHTLPRVVTGLGIPEWEKGCLVLGLGRMPSPGTRGASAPRVPLHGGYSAHGFGVLSAS